MQQYGRPMRTMWEVSDSTKDGANEGTSRLKHIYEIDIS